MTQAIEQASQAAWEMFSALVMTAPYRENLLAYPALGMVAIGVRAALASPEWARALVDDLDADGYPLHTDNQMARQVIEALPMARTDAEVA